MGTHPRHPLRPDAPRWRKDVALSFNGTTQYLNCDTWATLFGSSSYTVGGWIRRDGTDASLRVVFGRNRRSDDANNLFIGITGSATNIGFVFDRGGAVSKTQHNTTDVSDGNWHSWVLRVGTLGALRLDVDGVKEWTATGSTGLGASTDILTIGAETDPANNYSDHFDGDMMQVFGYAQALSMDSYTPAIYNSGAGVDMRLLPKPPPCLLELGSTGFGELGRCYGTDPTRTAVANQFVASSLIASGR